MQEKSSSEKMAAEVQSGAKILDIPGIGWSPQAALASALQESPGLDAVLILKLRDGCFDGFISSEMSNSEAVWLLERAKQEFV